MRMRPRDLSRDSGSDVGAPNAEEQPTSSRSVHPAGGEAPAIPEMIGPYRILDRCGDGGMAAVYRASGAGSRGAERVAIKVISPGRSTPEFRRLFAHEWRVLAALSDHPNIVRYRETGETDDGTIYGVMDFIDGQRLDEYCDAHRLSIKERLTIFAQLCEIIHDVHQYGIVHCDLKPPNILVVWDEVKRRHNLKIVDFGIAQLRHPEAWVDSAAATEFARRVMTHAYASPEQWTQGRVTTAADIYALGCVLYEILTGERAQPVTGTSGSAEIDRIVCAENPTPPSLAALRGDSDDAARRAALRDCSSAAALASCLRGNLDGVVLHAMEKSPSKRYRSAAELGDDIRRHFAGRPVIPRRSDRAYVFGQWLKRHRRSVAAFSIATAALITASSLVAWQNVRIDRARAESARHLSVSLSLVDSLVNEFEQRIREMPGAIENRTLLISILRGHVDALRDAARSAPEAKKALADVFRVSGELEAGLEGGKAGDVASGIQSLRMAAGWYAELAEADPEDAAAKFEHGRCLIRLAEAIRRGDRPPSEAASLFESGLTLLGAEGVDATEEAAIERARGLRDYAALLSALDDPRGVRFAEESIAILRDFAGRNGAPSHIRWELSRSLLLAGEVLLRRGDANSAMNRFDEASRIRDGLLDESPRNVEYRRGLAAIYNRIGMAKLASGRRAEACRAFEEVRALSLRGIETDPGNVDLLFQLALATEYLGECAQDAEEAIARFEDASGIIERLYRADPSSVRLARRFARSSSKLAAAYFAQERIDEAVRIAEEVVKIADRMATGASSAPNRTLLASALQTAGAYRAEQARRAVAAGSPGRFDLALAHFHSCRDVLTRLAETADGREREKLDGYLRSLDEQIDDCKQALADV